MAEEAAKVDIVPDIIPGTVMLDGLRDGQVVEELAFALREMASLVLLHQKKGVVSLKVTIHPEPNRMVLVQDEITMTAPKAALPSTLRYVDEAGNLKNQNPDRPMLETIRDIGNAPEKEIREL